MALASGLGSSVGGATETTYGTVVTPNRFFEYDSETFARQQTYVEGLGLRSGRFVHQSGRVVQTTRQAGGQLRMDVPTKQFGWVLNQMHSATVTPTQQAATAAYLQTHNVGSSLSDRSATLQFNKPDVGGNDRAFTYPGSVLTAVEFSCEVGGLLKTELTYDSRDEESSVSTPAGPALTTPAYATGIKSFNHIQVVTFTIAGSAISALVNEFTLTWAQPKKEDRWGLGSGARKSKPIPNAFMTIEGNLDMEFTDMTEYQRFVDATQAQMILTFEGDTIEGAHKDTLTFTIPKVQYRGDSPNVPGPDVLRLAVPFRAFDDGTNPPLKIEYKSTDTAI